jgi:nucleoside-diphosphate-sugar epimerase
VEAFDDRRARKARRFIRDPGTNIRDLRLEPGATYLVTGCAGFIGSHLVEALSASGCAVIGVDGFIDNYSRAIKESNLRQCADRGMRFAELDLAETPIEPLLDGVDGVFHLAARPGVRTSWGSSFGAYTRDNLLVTQRVFEAAAKRSVRVVFASSSSVYGDAESYPVREDARVAPVSPYGVTKLAGEALAISYVESQGLDAVGLRYFSVYGPRQRPDMAFARVFQCLRGEGRFPLLGYGFQSREFTYVGDVVEATLLAMQRAPAGRVYNVGGGREIPMLDALLMCERITGLELEVDNIPEVAGDPHRTCADIGRAEAELGWSPSTSFEDGLRAQAFCALELEADRPEAEAVAR